MQASKALDDILNATMLTADDVNAAIDAIERIAKQNPSHAVSNVLLEIAKKLYRARHNIQAANAILDNALYTVQGAGPNFEIKSRK